MKLSAHFRARLSSRPRTRAELQPRALPHSRPLRAGAVAETMAPVRRCAGYLCAGVASEDHLLIFRTSMLIAQMIEHRGMYRGGLMGHIEVALIACSTLHDRALASGTWTPVEATFAECEAINAMVDLHELQLRKLTGWQLPAAANFVIAETLHAGGVAEHRATPSAACRLFHFSKSSPVGLITAAYTRDAELSGAQGFDTKAGCPDAQLKRLDKPHEDHTDKPAAWLPPVPALEQEMASL